MKDLFIYCELRGEIVKFMNDETLKLIFKEAKSDKDIKDIFDHTIDAFSDSPDFNWKLPEIKKEVKEGWKLFACKLDKEVIAAVFIKVEGKKLLSKNTAIKMNHHGSGYSHKIKEFLEETATTKKLSEIRHFCRIDNFRMYSLNESHGYEKTPEQDSEDGQVVEWVKKVGTKKLAKKK